jgi:hypothetical protein
VQANNFDTGNIDADTSMANADTACLRYGDLAGRSNPIGGPGSIERNANPLDVHWPTPDHQEHGDQAHPCGTWVR